MSRCPRCRKFVGHNPEEHGYFCNLKCQIEFSEEGPIKMTQEESDKIYKESMEKEMEQFLNSFPKRKKTTL